MSEIEEFVGYYRLADHLIEAASKEQIAEAARLLAVNVAHYRQRFGDIPLVNFERMMRTQRLDADTALLLAQGMETLAGVLGVTMGLQDVDEALH